MKFRATGIRVIGFSCRALQNWLQMPFLMLFPKIQMVSMTNQQGQVGKRIWSGAILTILGFFSHSSFSFMTQMPITMIWFSVHSRRQPRLPRLPAGQCRCKVAVGKITKRIERSFELKKSILKPQESSMEKIWRWFLTFELKVTSEQTANFDGFVRFSKNTQAKFD